MIVRLARDYPEDFYRVFTPLVHESITITSSGLHGSTPPFDVLVRGVPTEQELRFSPHLKALVIPWAGLPRATSSLLADYPHIAVYNLHHNASATAELALAMLFAAARELVPIDRALREGDWRPRYADPTALLLEGSRVVIVGMGAIGRRIARVCLALGMRVTGVNRTGKPNNTLHTILDSSPDNFSLVGFNRLEEILLGARALVLCVPLTPQTERLIRAEQLRALADQAIVINVSRGVVVDEAALFEELKSGRLRAGVDVWYNYPSDEAEQANTPPSTFPFGELDNVIMTPHLAAHTTSTEEYRARELATLLNGLAGYGPAPTPIDLSRGY